MRSPSALLVALTACALQLTTPFVIGAQGRELHWRAIDVEARLDSVGELHVSERQAMIFTGDWNGGERRFNVRLGQNFSFEQLSLVDSATEKLHPLVEGDLAQIGRYGWGKGHSLRWRSRLPTDPEFLASPLTYVIEYSLGNILIPRGNEYVLDNDFLFPDRSGEVERFTLHLTLDPVWAAPSEYKERYSAEHLPPGEGFVVRLPLRYRPAGRPASVQFGAPPFARMALVTLLALAAVVFIARFFQRESSLGRFAPTLDPGTINEEWLKANVFTILPEVVGAMWDDWTGSAEVAAVLARMVSEKKLASKVLTTGKGFFSRSVLYLELLVDRHTLPDYENKLVAAFFTGSSRTTDTDEVRARYKKTGFDPSSIISPALESLKRVATGAGGKYPKPSKRLTIFLLLAAVALLGAGVAQRPSDILRVGPWIGGILFAAVVALSQAAVWRTRVIAPGPHALRMLIPILLAMGVVSLAVLNDDNRAGILVLAGVTILLIAFLNNILNIARSRHPAERIALRKRLAAAREYFRRELRKESPALRDEWYPYFLAFGLGSQVDKWFRSFGGDNVTRASTIGSSGYVASSLGTSGVSGATSAPSFSGFGGGGGFSGGGSSGSWSSAVSSF
ncbi:MAG: hypothetical protein ABIT38_21260, partial [Gemmatimonadaceae bacterium]